MQIKKQTAAYKYSIKAETSMKILIISLKLSCGFYDNYYCKEIKYILWNFIWKA